MIELKDDELVFRFPEVHESAKLRVGFQRTLRIPDDNRAYPLPLGFGTFPLNHVDDYADRVPEAWRRHGGVFLPMHQAEAMWINFRTSYPMAVKVAAGKIDALTGKQWKNDLSSRPQDYLVVPDQPWLDGFSVGKGMIRQFVRDAAWGRVHSGGTTNRRGAARWASDHRLRHEGVEISGVAKRERSYARWPGVQGASTHDRNGLGARRPDAPKGLRGRIRP